MCYVRSYRIHYSICYVLCSIVFAAASLPGGAAKRMSGKEKGVVVVVGVGVGVGVVGVGVGVGVEVVL